MKKIVNIIMISIVFSTLVHAEVDKERFIDLLIASLFSENWTLAVLEGVRGTELPSLFFTEEIEPEIARIRPSDRSAKNPRYYRVVQSVGLISEYVIRIYSSGAILLNRSPRTLN
jgi:hypothetical protein